MTQVAPTPLHQLDPEDYFTQPERAQLRRMYRVLGQCCLEPKTKTKVLDGLPNRNNVHQYGPIFDELVLAGLLSAQKPYHLTYYTLTPAGEEWLNKWFAKFGRKRGTR